MFVYKTGLTLQSNNEQKYKKEMAIPFFSSFLICITLYYSYDRLVFRYINKPLQASSSKSNTSSKPSVPE